MRKTLGFFPYSFLILLPFVALASDPTPPLILGEAQDGAIRVLQGLVRIDTVNPPGNETAAAVYLKKQLDAAGVDSKIIEAVPGRGNLIARLKGDGSKKPVLLVSHLDVVGVERAHWGIDPFSGEIKNGRLYGRGASDVKDLAAIQMMAMLLLKKSGLPLRRDVILASVADEESGGGKGMKYLVENHWKEIEAEFAFNEGSRGKPYLKNGKVQWASLQVAERRSVNLRVRASGTSGHSMLQMPDNAISTLSGAVYRISQYKAPLILNAASKKYVEGIASLEHRPKDWYKKASAGTSEEALGLYGMLHNTINPTLIEGGFRSNVIPAEAKALINCRILPGVRAEDLVAELTRVVHDPRVTIEVEGTVSPDVPISSMESAAVRAYEKVIHANFGKEVPFIPTVGAGTTDSRYLRAKGVDSYALEPFDDQPQNGHGNDESVSVEGVRNAVKLYYEVLVELAT